MITAYSQTRIGNATVVTVTSDRGEPVLYYHWYVDGVWVGSTTAPERAFYLDSGDEATILCLDTADPAFDGAAAGAMGGGAAPGWSARRSIWWVRSAATDVAYYRVDQSKAGGAWAEIGRIPADETRWDYSLLTSRLDDLTEYAWRVVPVDMAGNDGTALALDAETVVRTPDSPDYAIAFSAETTRVTWSEAA